MAVMSNLTPIGIWIEHEEQSERLALESDNKIDGGMHQAAIILSATALAYAPR